MFRPVMHSFCVDTVYMSLLHPKRVSIRPSISTVIAVKMSILTKVDSREEDTIDKVTIMYSVHHSFSKFDSAVKIVFTCSK
jgi:hypothetical protein